MADSVTICSNALVELGGSPISSFTDGSIGITAGSLYPLERARVMRAKPWTFLQTTLRNNAFGTTDDGLPFQKEFLLIPNIVRLWEVTDLQGSRIAYALGESRFLYADQESIMCTMSYDKPEADWPIWFEDLMQAAMKARLAYAQTNSRTMADQCKADYKTLVQQYAAIEATEHESHKLGQDSRYLGVRY